MNHLNYDFRDDDQFEIQEGMLPCMFVLSVQNYNGFKYFRMNREKYSAYASEQEIILADGTQAYVIGVEQMTID